MKKDLAVNEVGGERGNSVYRHVVTIVVGLEGDDIVIVAALEHLRMAIERPVRLMQLEVSATLAGQTSGHHRDSGGGTHLRHGAQIDAQRGVTVAAEVIEAVGAQQQCNKRYVA